MQWQFILALVLAIPIILFPVAFIWYLNVKGTYGAIRRAREQGTIRTAELQKEAERNI